MSDKAEQKNPFDLENLRKLIDTKTREEIAQALKCDTSLVTRHYNNQRIVQTEYLIKYAEYFNVSVDYLLGLTTYKTELDTDEGKLVRTICEYTGLSEKALKELKQFSKNSSKIWLSKFIEKSSPVLDLRFSEYNYALNASTENLKLVITNYKKALEGNKAPKEAPDIDKYADVEYERFLLASFINEVVDNCFTDEINLYKKLKNEKLDLYRELYERELI